MHTSESNRGALPNFAEAAGIARLLAEVTRRPVPATPPVEKPPDEESERSTTATAIASPELPPPLPKSDDRPVRQLFAQANWRNAPPQEKAPTEPARAKIRPTRRPPTSAPLAGPDYVPVGVVAVAEFLSRINWRNRPDEVKPLPEVRPTGYEWTVEAVMSSFFGD